MSTTQVKEQLHDYIDKADDRLLWAVYGMMQNYFAEDEAIIAFSVKGEPLTKADMLNGLRSGLQEVEGGAGLSSADIRQIKQGWK